MLKIFHSVLELNKALDAEKDAGKSIGFVPTMGALHSGHISLIENCRQQTDVSVCSIFVNPTQFNDPADYNKYPRNTEFDKIILDNSGCDYLFLPDVAEIYPSESYKHISFDPGELGMVLDGAYRPGHFSGMAAVVKRLFDIVSPDKAFFGQKDYQQYLIVKKVISYYKMPVEIVKCDTVREKNGLAMSSRNKRLSEQELENASLIYKTLKQAEREIKSGIHSFETIEKQAVFDLTAKGRFNVDYFDICSAETLEKVNNRETGKQLAILTAVWIRDVRLIDNILV